MNEHYTIHKDGHGWVVGLVVDDKPRELTDNERAVLTNLERQRVAVKHQLWALDDQMNKAIGEVLRGKHR